MQNSAIFTTSAQKKCKLIEYFNQKIKKKNFNCVVIRLFFYIKTLHKILTGLKNNMAIQYPMVKIQNLPKQC